jgi:hypothetical protein
MAYLFSFEPVIELKPESFAVAAHLPAMLNIVLCFDVCMSACLNKFIYPTRLERNLPPSFQTVSNIQKKFTAFVSLREKKFDFDSPLISYSRCLTDL